MPLIVLIFLVACYLLRNGLALLLRRRPVLKAERLKFGVVMMAFVVAISLLLEALLASVRMYGYSLGSLTFGSAWFYAAAVLLLACIGLMLKVVGDYAGVLQTRAVIVGIDKAYALPNLYATLERMGMTYQETASGVHLPGPHVDIEVGISAYEIRFRVADALDMLLLNRLCRAYQQQYREDALPLPWSLAVFSLLYGVLCLAGAGYLLVDWVVVRFFRSCLFFCS